MSLHARSLAAGLAAALVVAQFAVAQQQTTPPDGLRENRATTHVLRDAKIVAVDKTIEKGSIVVRDGKIVAVGENVAVPPGARVWDATGKTIYPGFIDAYSEASESAAPPRESASNWNEQATPERRAAQTLDFSSGRREALRKVGVVAAVVAPSAGIIRGQSALVSTADGNPADVVLNDSAALHAKLTPGRGRGRRESFPGSPMGAVALLRQTFYDAAWYRDAERRAERDPLAPRPEQNESLAALRAFIPQDQPAQPGRLVVFDAPDELYALRADGLMKEFNLTGAIRGSGREYRRLTEIAATKRPFILPLNFPKPPDVSSPTLARDVQLERLLHWDLAPENPAKLAQAKVTFAISTIGLKDVAEFLPALRIAVARGLPAVEALRALTETPADLFGAPSLRGRLEAGSTASFVVVEGDLFADDESEVVETWVDGRRYPTEPTPASDLSGAYKLAIDGAAPNPGANLVITGEADKPSAKITRDGAPDKDSAKTDKLSIDGGHIRFMVKEKSLGLPGPGVAILDGQRVGDRIDGNGLRADGAPFRWSGVYSGPAPKEEKKDDDKKSGDKTNDAGADKPKDGAKQPDAVAKSDEAKDKDKSDDDKEDGDNDDVAKDKKTKAKKSKPALFAPNYPLGAWGVAGPVEAPKAVLFRNATVWVCDGTQPLPETDVLVVGGKIEKVGRKLDAPASAVIVDAAGKHLTPGLIDCHSHSATDGGINESTQSITAEVRIGDFIDCDDVNIYRELAGGVTSINVLHGSANCIGGQNQVLKLRWGHCYDDLRFTDAPPGIKFALGENVKQSNWGEDHTSRYPQSRLGVDQVSRDAFQAAREYAERWRIWNAAPNGVAGQLPPRRDLELDALAEVVSGQRLIHCHSYRQDEIVAFLRVCEDFGVRVATLQHILEGYKVAEVLRAHGAGGSSFSDWWAYKFEVIDSIPYNGAIMHNQGILVSFNSDSNELARRLAWETAKAVKYGGVPEHQALQFVTLNPAKQLRIDQRVGSIEPGKDADLALWNGSPLSSLAVCEQTWIDGRKYFDRMEDRDRQAEASKKKAALVQRILDSGEEPAEEEPVEEKSFWPRHDEFCHHGHHEGHDEHSGHEGHK